MRIQELHLKNFGKFTDRHIYFPEQIHVFYGENEYGKSTVYAFIKAMLFGLERGRGRAAANDEFSRYEPWENPNYYAGVMRFCCGGRVFRLERQFDRYSKTVSLICEDDGEELSVEDGDLEMLLGGMTAASFENTAAIGQLTARPGQGLAAELRNYAANYYETGGSDVDLQGALDFLKEKKKGLEQKLKQYREKCEKRKEKLEIQKRYVEAELERLNEELEAAESDFDRQMREAAESDFDWQMREAAESDFDWQTQEPAEEVKNPGRNRDDLEPGFPGIWIVAAGGVLALIGAVLFAISWFSGHLPIALILEAVCVLTGSAAVIRGLLQKKQITGQRQKKGAAVDEESHRIQWEISRIKEERKEKLLLRNNLQEQIYETEAADEKEEKLREQLKAVDLAAVKLQEAAEDMAHQFGERLNREMSRILCKVTDGKYTRLNIDDRLNLTVLSDGRKIPVDRLSRGTIEQIYFSLRMAALSILYEEDVPVILDDAFVFYDEKRLKSTLKWLSEQPRQVIIFSCQTREKQIVDSL